MNVKKILKNMDFSVDKNEMKKLKLKVDEFLQVLRKEAAKECDAEVFLGGSFAKGTLVKSNEYDADIFVRFDWEYESLSEELEKILKPVTKLTGLKIKRMHGSRDYFRLDAGEGLTFEIIPVSKIKKVREARNVTDLSYFHVNYIRKKMTEKLRRELALAKKFFKSNGFYGAESYIQGFSGYGLECLIIYYKSFEKMLRQLVKIEGERIIMDIDKAYKKKMDVLFGLNESKIAGPIVLVDPTWKERNVLASLSWETFRKFQKVVMEFLENPGAEFFYERRRGREEFIKIARKRKAEFLELELETNKQEGDIAGTKMKKFYLFLSGLIKDYFEVLDGEFFYGGEGVVSKVYFVLKSKKEIVRAGPPLDRKEDVAKFKSANKNTFVRGGAIYSREKIDFDGRGFLEKWRGSREGTLKMRDMGMVKMGF
jgi:tRNA nucleotidyltransferase (CCA-adding enzyme)